MNEEQWDKLDQRIFRRITSLAPLDGGFLATYECGHEVWWAVMPTGLRAFCSNCAEQLAKLERTGS